MGGLFPPRLPSAIGECGETNKNKTKPRKQNKTDKKKEKKDGKKNKRATEKEKMKKGPVLQT